MTDLLTYTQQIAASMHVNLYSNAPVYQDTLANSQDYKTYLYPNEFNDSNQFAPIATLAPVAGLGVGDVFAIANWLKNISREFGVLPRQGETSTSGQTKAKGAAFLATQLALFAFNPGDPQNGGGLNQVYNPLSVPLSAVPGLRVTTTIGSPNSAAALSLDGNVYRQATQTGGDLLDHHELMRKGVYKRAATATDLVQLHSNTPGFRGDITDTTQNTLDNATSIYSVEDIVDNGNKIAAFANVHNNINNPDQKYADKIPIDLGYIEDQIKGGTQTAQQVQLKSLFKNDSSTLLPFGLGKQQDIKYSWMSNVNQQNTKIDPITYPNNFDAEFATFDDPNTSLSSQVIPDDQMYMPFMFQDLRDPTPTYLYFKAFLKDGIAESFEPNWDVKNYYGRVDPVAIYQNTTRNITIGFDIVAWDYKDLNVIYRKLTKLQSMVYPTFDTQQYIQAGPLIRMRVGDLFSAGKSGDNKRGLPGYIDSLNFSYDDGIWNVTTDFKVPRKISVTLNFVVIHDGNPGVYQVTNPNGTTIINKFGAYVGTGDNSLDVSTPSVRGIMDQAQDPSYNATSLSSLSDQFSKIS